MPLSFVLVTVNGPGVGAGVGVGVGAGCTVVVAAAELFARFESGLSLVTVAVLLSVPDWVGVTLMLIVAEPLKPNVPRLQVTVPFD